MPVTGPNVGWWLQKAGERTEQSYDQNQACERRPWLFSFFLFVCLYFSYLSLKEHCVVVRKIFIDFFFFALLPKQTE